MVQVINTIIISELLAEGEARLRRQIDEYIVRSVRIIGVMQDLLYVSHQPHLFFFTIKGVPDVQQDCHVSPNQR
jgi:hypothetical protein